MGQNKIMVDLPAGKNTPPAAALGENSEQVAGLAGVEMVSQMQDSGSKLMEILSAFKEAVTFSLMEANQVVTEGSNGGFNVDPSQKKLESDVVTLPPKNGSVTQAQLMDFLPASTHEESKLKLFLKGVDTSQTNSNPPKTGFQFGFTTTNGPTFYSLSGFNYNEDGKRSDVFKSNLNAEPIREHPKGPHIF